MPQALAGLQQQQLEPAGCPDQPANGVTAQQRMAVTVFDYCNGGPFFTAQDGNPTIDSLPGVSLLAEYCQVPLAMPAAALPGQRQQQQPQPGEQEFARRAAAVRCRVGEGVAVLCGTHPELGPEWLDPCGESNAAQGPQPHEAAAPAAAAGPAGASIPRPSQLQQQAARAAASCLQTLVQDAAVSRTAVAASTSSSSGGVSLQQMMPVVCRDVSLAAHAQQLRRELEVVQAERDLFLCSLLFEALPQQRLGC